MNHNAVMPEQPRLEQLQRAFSAYIRNPDEAPLPQGVDPRRMAVYSELFFNNINDFLSTAFPVLHQISDADYWLALVRDFYARHPCKSPLFNQVAREFIEYLALERDEHPDDPPFLYELAHYEWVELALGIEATDLSCIPAERNGDLLDHIPVLSPLAWPLSYRFAVHRIGPDHLPQQPGSTATHLLVYRDRNDAIGFLELNTVSARLLHMLCPDNPLSGRQLLENIADDIGHNNPEVVVQGGLSLMQDLLERDVLLGTHPSPAPGAGGVK